MRPILCCTDLGEASRPALIEALRLAQALKAPLQVLHVCAPPYPDPGYFTLAVEDADLVALAGQRVRRSAEACLAALLRETKEALGLDRVLARPLVQEGMPARTIVQEAEREGAELIVVGTHARTGLPHLLLGSVAERVLRTAPCPVLTVPPTHR